MSLQQICSIRKYYSPIDGPVLFCYHNAIRNYANVIEFVCKYIWSNGIDANRHKDIEWFGLQAENIAVLFCWGWNGRFFAQGMSIARRWPATGNLLLLLQTHCASMCINLVERTTLWKMVWLEPRRDEIERSSWRNNHVWAALADDVGSCFSFFCALAICQLYPNFRWWWWWGRCMCVAFIYNSVLEA